MNDTINTALSISYRWMIQLVQLYPFHFYKLYDYCSIYFIMMNYTRITTLSISLRWIIQNTTLYISYRWIYRKWIESLEYRLRAPGLYSTSLQILSKVYNVIDQTQLNYVFQYNYLSIYLSYNCLCIYLSIYLISVYVSIYPTHGYKIEWM